jgi:hypothetical protein
MTEPDLKCVNAHDRCFEGGPCPLCERVRRREALRELTKLTEEFGGYEELKGDNEETAR